MSSAQGLRQFINERLTAAAEEIFSEFERTIVQCEEEIDRQRRLLDNIWKPQNTLHTTDFPQQHVCNKDEVLPDKHPYNQERNSSLNQEVPQIKEDQEEHCNNLDQDDPKHPQVKQSQEAICTSRDQEDPEPSQIKEVQKELTQEEEQLVQKQDIDTFALFQCKSICKETPGEILKSAAAEEEIVTESEKRIVQCEKDNDRQHSMLDIIWKPQNTLHTTDFPQQHVCNKDEVLPDKHPYNQERNSSLNQEVPQIKEDQEEHCNNLDQDDPKHPQVKQRQEAICTSWDQEDPEPSQIKEIQKELTQEEEQLVQKQDIDTFALFQCKSICKETPREILKSAAAEEEIVTESEKMIVQCEKDNDRQHRLLDIIWKPEIKLHRIDFPQQHVCNKEEVLADQQHCNQKRNSSLNQEDPKPPQIKEGQEGLCTSQEEEQIVLRLDTSEESDNSETEPDNDQFLFQNSTVAESQVQKRRRHIDLQSSRNAELKPKKRHLSERGHNNMEENCPMLESHCDTDTETERKHVKCDVCGKAFKYRSGMRYHRRVHTGQMPYACSTCGKKFARMSSLKNHNRIHTDEKPYLCEICGKRFRATVGLTNHTRTHTGEKLYSCETCGKGFTQRGRLLCHKRIHTGEKPYSCETCGKSFIQSPHLLRHMRTHTGEKPYSCVTCGKSFSQNETLKVHMRTHTGHRPYVCRICGKKFKVASALTRHMRTHMSERPYFCILCGEIFNQREDFLCHMKIHKG